MRSRQRLAAAGTEPPRETAEDGEQVRQLAAFGDLRLKSTGVQADAARRYRQRRAFDSIVANDHVGCADELTDFDDGRAAQRSGYRKIELLEGTNALRSGDGARTAGPQAVGQQHGCSLAQPLEARLVPRVFEWNDEDPRRGRWGHRPGARNGLRSGGRGQAAHRETGQQKQMPEALHAAAAGSLAVAPRTSIFNRQPFPLLDARHSSTAASACNEK